MFNSAPHTVMKKDKRGIAVYIDGKNKWFHGDYQEESVKDFEVINKYAMHTKNV